MKILVIQQKMIGDVLTSSVLFELIKKKHPNYKLHYLINNHTSAVVENNPLIDKIIFFSPKVEQNYWELLKFLWGIKKQKYDAVIDLYGKISSALVTLFSLAKIKVSYHKKYTSFIYTDAIKRLKQAENGLSLALENRIKLLQPLGVKFEAVKPRIYLSEKEKELAKMFLKNNGLELEKPILMVSVLGSSSSKTYPKPYMATLIDAIGKIDNIQIIFNYIPAQIESVKAIFKACRPETQEKIFLSVYSKKLRDFIGVTSQCMALIGNEGGAVNMAKALGVSTFAIFSPKLNKENWFGVKEASKHQAIHIGDFEENISDPSTDIKMEYLKMKPEYIIPKLDIFLNKLL